MKLVRSFLLFLSLLMASSYSLAQVSLEGVSSGRYEVRKSSKAIKARRPASEVEEAAPVITDADGLKVRTLKASEIAAEDKAKKDVETKKSEVQKQETSVPSSNVTVAAPTTTPVLTETPEVEEPTIGEQAESLFSSKANKIYDFYREQIHPDDIRNNRVELDVMPVVVYNDSQSNFTYRDYQSFFDALKFKSNVWFTPLIGISGEIMFSFAADVDSLAADRSRIPAKYEMVDFGLNFRKFFGVSRKSSSLEFSVLYTDDKMTVPSDNTSRPRLKTQGVGAGLKARMPSSANYAWVFGGSFFPRLQHSESATGANIQSGASGENIRIGLNLGGEWKFTRESQMIWDMGVSAERNIFGGSASLPDPSTGLTPTNVSVTNTLYMFSLGYRWGR